MLTRSIATRFGQFLIPAEGEISRHSEICAMGVFNGEYEYVRLQAEPVRTIVDVGCNLGAFATWARRYMWPGVEVIHMYDPNVQALNIARCNMALLPGPRVAQFYHAAVTSAPDPVYFREQENWGGSRTWGETTGVVVPRILPGDLPAADVLKVDAEGVEPEVFEAYQHWAVVQVVLFESHGDRHLDALEDRCRKEGLTMVRGNPNHPEADVQVWARR